MSLGGCGKCQSSLMPSDETYVEGCGCVANPDRVNVHPPYCGATPYGSSTGYTDAHAASDAKDSSTNDADANDADSDGGAFTDGDVDDGDVDAGADI